MDVQRLQQIMDLQSMKKYRQWTAGTGETLGRRDALVAYQWVAQNILSEKKADPQQLASGNVELIR